jgi:hypothetical protein
MRDLVRPSMMSFRENPEADSCPDRDRALLSRAQQVNHAVARIVEGAPREHSYTWPLLRHGVGERHGLICEPIAGVRSEAIVGGGDWHIRSPGYGARGLTHCIRSRKAADVAPVVVTGSHPWQSLVGGKTLASPLTAGQCRDERCSRDTCADGGPMAARSRSGRLRPGYRWSGTSQVAVPPGHRRSGHSPRTQRCTDYPVRRSVEEGPWLPCSRSERRISRVCCRRLASPSPRHPPRHGIAGDTI